MSQDRTECGRFAALTGYRPVSWQQRLLRRFCQGNVLGTLDLPTGLGKTW